MASQLPLRRGPGREVSVDGSERTVLCIDDDCSVLTMHRMVLESVGYVVLTASSAQAGIELFASCPADAVLLDYGTPEMNGGEVAALMKKEMKPAIPVLMLSALPPLPENARSVDAFVSKGGSPEIWLDVLAVLLNSRSSPPLSSASKFPLPAAA